MYNKIISAVSVFVLSILFLVTTHVDAASAETKRLWGTNRYQTCSQIANEGWNNSDYAVLVNGENFPDALSASVLAKKYNAPILLTGSTNLDDNASTQLTRLNVKKVFIVGGNGVVGSIIQDVLYKKGISVERFYGDNRYATSIAVAKQIGTQNGIILTTGSDYTDALSVAPIAAKLQMPIILMPKDSVPDSVNSFITGKNISRTYVLGDSNIISDSVAAGFPNVQRINGSDKYERNINIIKTFEDKFDFSKACLAYSEGFADALSGSAYAAIAGNPIILVGDTPSANIKNLITGKNLSKIYVIGGTAGITESTVSGLLGTTPIPTSTEQAKEQVTDTIVAEDPTLNYKMQYTLESVHKGKTLLRVAPHISYTPPQSSIDGKKTVIIPKEQKEYVTTYTAKGEFIVVQLTVENLGKDAVQYINRSLQYLDGYLQDSDGSKYSPVQTSDTDLIASDESKDEVKIGPITGNSTDRYDPKFKYNVVLVFDAPSKDGEYFIGFDASYKESVRIKLQK